MPLRGRRGEEWAFSLTGLYVAEGNNERSEGLCASQLPCDRLESIKWQGLRSASDDAAELNH
ncbi:hypothetical protein E4U42_004368 [Claviceps africana]|uniref:Uncharacterized protein n=1 Tax=Claviceps africana TaxID=83212 RepID=A0A8K0JEA4_9HYPO|nr:hypothetical protein E4U42_004368 [Claviceps africana]